MYDLRTNTMFVPKHMLEDQGELLVGIGHEGQHRIQRGSDLSARIQRLAEAPRNVSSGIVGAARGAIHGHPVVGWREGISRSVLRRETEAYTLDLRRLNEMAAKYGSEHVAPNEDPASLYGYLQHIGESTGREANTREVTEALMHQPVYALTATLAASKLAPVGAGAGVMLVGGAATGAYYGVNALRD